MIISDQCQFIYIHIPRTDGRNLITSFAEIDIEHHNPSKLDQLANQIGLNHDYHKHKFGQYDSLAVVKKHMPKEVFDGYFKFTVVRNPWDKLIVDYIDAFGEPGAKKTPPKPLKKISNFKEYVQFCAENPDAVQYNYIALENNAIGTDFIARQEYLEQDFATICDKLNINCELIGKNMKSMRYNFFAYYSPEIFEEVAKHWQKDIAVFNYGHISYTSKLGECIQIF